MKTKLDDGLMRILARANETEEGQSYAYGGGGLLVVVLVVVLLVLLLR